MKADKILKSDYLDILFENRNKQYGAYVLRATYGRRIMQAVAGALATGGLLLFLLQLQTASSGTAAIDPEQGLETDVLRLPPPVVPPAPAPVQAPAAVTPKPAKPVKRNPVENSVPVFVDQPDPVKIPTGDVDVPAATGGSGASTGTGDPGPGDGSSGGTGSGPAADPVPDPAPPVVDNNPVMYAEVMPAYPGGREALMRYLQGHLQDYVTDEGRAIKVTVNFIIEKDGSVTAITIAETDDAEFNKKVMKAFTRMPKWSPGRQQDQPVRVYYRIPVQLVPAE